MKPQAASTWLSRSSAEMFSGGGRVESARDELTRRREIGEESIGFDLCSIVAGERKASEAGVSCVFVSGALRAPFYTVAAAGINS